MLVYPDNSPCDRDYLSRWFINGNHLIITDTWINENNINDISRYLKEIDNIIYDFTHNPFEFDNFILPSFDKPYTILINDFRFFYQHHPGVCWFPVFFYLWNQKNPLFYQTVDFELKTDSKNLGISCLNNMPSLHRMIFYHHIRDLLAQNKMLFTFKRIEYAGTSQDWNLLNNQERDWIAKNHTMATHDEQRYHNDVGISHSAYQDYALNVVTETTMDTGFLSEKICKPLASDQFFLVLASDQTIKFLSNIGFDTFVDLLDHKKYDNVKDMRDRIKIVTEYLVSIIDQNWSRLNQDYSQRLKKNRKWLFSREFENIITFQIVQSSQNWR
jgi:hypothetical protein